MSKNKIILLCVICYIVTVYSRDDKVDEMKTDTQEVNELEIDTDKIETLPNYLQPVDAVKTDTQKVNQLKINKQKIRKKDQRKLKRKNQALSKSLQPVGVMKTDTQKVNELKTQKIEKIKLKSNIRKLSNTLKPARVIDFGLLFPTPLPSYVNCVREFLLEKKWPPIIVDDIVKRCNKETWPSGFTTTLNYSYMEENRKLLKDYKCRYIPLRKFKVQAVIVFFFENTAMPDNMNANLGFLMIFKTNEDKAVIIE